MGDDKFAIGFIIFLVIAVIIGGALERADAKKPEKMTVEEFAQRILDESEWCIKSFDDPNHALNAIESYLTRDGATLIDAEKAVDELRSYFRSIEELALKYD